MKIRKIKICAAIVIPILTCQVQVLFILVQLSGILFDKRKIHKLVMSDLKSEIDSDVEQHYSLNSNVDPKNMQELTIYVSVYSIQ